MIAGIALQTMLEELHRQFFRPRSRAKHFDLALP